MSHSIDNGRIDPGFWIACIMIAIILYLQHSCVNGGVAP